MVGQLGRGNARHGREATPPVFFATCVRLLPNDVRVTVELCKDDKTLVTLSAASGHSCD